MKDEPKTSATEPLAWRGPCVWIIDREIGRECSLSEKNHGGQTHPFVAGTPETSQTAGQEREGG